MAGHHNRAVCLQLLNCTPLLTCLQWFMWVWCHTHFTMHMHVLPCIGANTASIVLPPGISALVAAGAQAGSLSAQMSGCSG
eukprot:365748-Chlamydomonas_euryale.AAC.4